MSLKRLTRVKCVPQKDIEALQQHGVYTSKDFLSKSPLELMTVLGYSYSQLQALIITISKASAPHGQNALSLYEGGKKCVPTSLHRLDSLLRGGLPSGMITEISGPPGCGKTQFCVTVAVVTALSAGQNVAYIDTEGAFSAERLVEIAKYRHPNSSSSEHLLALASRVHVFTEMTCDILLERLAQLEEIIVDKKIRLVIVDSIASLVRKEFNTSSKKGVADRAALLNTQAARLKYVAESFKIPILVTNQITTKVSHDQEEDSIVTVALGNSWSHAVNTRLLMQYREGNMRTVTVSKSPLCDMISFVVSIENEGLILDNDKTDKLVTDEEKKDPQRISLAVHSTMNPHTLSSRV
ncbi:DNA repair protein RAD51 homolog 2-like [Halichondria panicea]|uniref:DNA repair protein RAD51 homolog 2-like n=1 Tax=Halichondria panicea TaxID=6063 RepID=UPI00312BA42A